MILEFHLDLNEILKPFVTDVIDAQLPHVWDRATKRYQY